MPYPFIPMPSQFKVGVHKQYNIMALVGNGFDIQVMHEYDQRSTTRYPDFYHFMKMKNVDPSNLVLRQMEKALTEKRHDWSDVEACIDALASSGTSVDEIRSALDEVRVLFSEFLNGVVTPGLLSEFGEDSQKNGWAKASLSQFLGDLENIDDLKRVPFGARQANYDFYNFYFVNFNYTSLLDDYVHMDSVQFDPAPNSTVETNFIFNTDPKNLSEDPSWNFDSSSNVEVQVVHPHGYQDVPRSILFGTNGDGDKRSRTAKLAKTYWGRVDTRYSHLFDDTDLFIVFGCSLGRTDSWWWSHIAQSLSSANGNERALLIYWWNPLSQPKRTRDEVIDTFLDAARVDNANRKGVAERICVASYNDNDERIWLNTSGRR